MAQILEPNSRIHHLCDLGQVPKPLCASAALSIIGIVMRINEFFIGL